MMINSETHDLKSFGEKLNLAIKQFKLTKFHAAEILDMRSCDLSDILEGRVPIEQEAAMRIFNDFCVDLHEFKYSTHLANNVLQFPDRLE